MVGGGGGGQRVATMLPYLVKTLRKESIRPSNRTLPSLRRTFSLYDQINIIDTVPEDQLRFQWYGDTGFTVNGVKYEGSLLVVENKLMTWVPKTFSEITPESLSVFKILRPVPEILILGCGRHIQPVSPQLRQFIRSTGMKLEVIDSRNAASTYNILAKKEGQWLLPFSHMELLRKYPMNYISIHLEARNLECLRVFGLITRTMET